MSKLPIAYRECDGCYLNKLLIQTDYNKEADETQIKAVIITEEVDADGKPLATSTSATTKINLGDPVTGRASLTVILETVRDGLRDVYDYMKQAKMDWAGYDYKEIYE